MTNPVTPMTNESLGHTMKWILFIGLAVFSGIWILSQISESSTGSFKKSMPIEYNDMQKKYMNYNPSQGSVTGIIQEIRENDDFLAVSFNGRYTGFIVPKAGQWKENVKVIKACQQSGRRIFVVFKKRDIDIVLAVTPSR